MSQIDPYGRVVLDPDEAFARLYAGASIGSLHLEAEPARDLAAVASRWDRPDLAIPAAEALAISPEAYHAERAATWMIGQADEDMRTLLHAACTTSAEHARIDEEMAVYEERGLVPLLHAMRALVAHCRASGVVWGVGRGSSVASYVLYKLGVHKNDSLAYGLSIRDFLKPDPA